MAIIKTYTPGENTFLLVWKITEDAQTLEKFTGNINDTQTTSPKHNLHWLASRAALATHFGPEAIIHIQKDQYNKPSMTVDGESYHLSITHSFELAAVMFSKFRMVALDLEKIDSRVGRVSHKFMNAAEDEMLKEATDVVYTQTLIWSGKETLYKFYGVKELDFRQHMTIFTNKPQLRGCLHKSTPLFYDMFTTLIDNYVLTYMSE